MSKVTLPKITVEVSPNGLQTCLDTLVELGLMSRRNFLTWSESQLGWRRTFQRRRNQGKDQGKAKRGDKKKQGKGNDPKAPSDAKKSAPKPKARTSRKEKREAVFTKVIMSLTDLIRGDSVAEAWKSKLLKEKQLWPKLLDKRGYVAPADGNRKDPFHMTGGRIQILFNELDKTIKSKRHRIKSVPELWEVLGLTKGEANFTKAFYPKLQIHFDTSDTVPVLNEDGSETPEEHQFRVAVEMIKRALAEKASSEAETLSPTKMAETENVSGNSNDVPTRSAVVNLEPSKVTFDESGTPISSEPEGEEGEPASKTSGAAASGNTSSEANPKTPTKLQGGYVDPRTGKVFAESEVSPTLIERLKRSIKKLESENPDPSERTEREVELRHDVNARIRALQNGFQAKLNGETTCVTTCVTSTRHNIVTEHSDMVAEAGVQTRSKRKAGRRR